jgi:fimbrial chaperone protein
MRVSTVTTGIFISLLLGSMTSQDAKAGSALTVFPATVFMTADQMSGTVKLTNNGEAKINLQVDILQWTQHPETGADTVAPATDVVIFPKIVSIDAGQEQVVRIGQKTRLTGDRERAYRLSVRELPTGKPQASSTGAQMMLNLSIPLFISPQKPQKQFALAHAELAQGQLLVTVRNTGNSYVKLQTLTATGLDAAGQETFTVQKAGWYVLAGNARIFSLANVPAQGCRASQTIRIAGALEYQSLPPETLDIKVDAGQCPAD